MTQDQSSEETNLHDPATKDNTSNATNLKIQEKLKDFLDNIVDTNLDVIIPRSTILTEKLANDILSDFASKKKITSQLIKQKYLLLLCFNQEVLVEAVTEI
jgi:hypothetical protein